MLVTNPTSLLSHLTSLSHLSLESLPIDKDLRNALPTLTNLTSLTLTAAAGQPPIKLPRHLRQCAHLASLEVAPLSWSGSLPLPYMSSLTTLRLVMEPVLSHSGQQFLQLDGDEGVGGGAAAPPLAGAQAQAAAPEEAAGVAGQGEDPVDEDGGGGNGEGAGEAMEAGELLNEEEDEEMRTAEAALAAAVAQQAAAHAVLVAAMAERTAAHAQLRGAVLALLAHVRQLRHVAFETDACLTAEQIACLGAGWSQLTELELCCSGLGNDGGSGDGGSGGAAAAIRDAFPALRHLRLRCHTSTNCQPWSPPAPLAYGALQLPSGLRSLELHNVWNMPAIGAVGLLPNLQLSGLVLRSWAPAQHALSVPQMQAMLGCSGNACTSSNSPAHGSSMQHLDIACTWLSNALCAAIASACGPKLTCLRLAAAVADHSSSCSISGAGLAALLPSLTACEELSLMLPETAFDWKAWKALGCGKLRLRRLQLFAVPTVGSGGLSADGGRRFCAALQRVAAHLPRTLRKLVVGSCGGEVAAEELERAVGALLAALPTGCRVVVRRSRFRCSVA